MEETRMTRALKSGMPRRRTVVAAVAVLGFTAAIAPPGGSAQPEHTIELQSREANPPADHQALAAWYEKAAQAHQRLAGKHLLMREVDAAARSVERKDRAGDHHAFVARKYQERAQAYERLAARHRMVAEPLK
jgi:hypothetical protein